jgi:tetratricopeptide (TPR) repeat protein
MPKETQSDPRKNFVPRFLPWLLGGVMLVVYGFTLNHWVTLLNIGQVAAVSGWTWQPQIYNPLTFLATLPFRLVPVAHIPAALNLFSAGCAAATLAVLARSVAILPHDRTEMERMRERSDFSFLTSWVAWVPPVVAVFFAGLQLPFWENATSFTGESFELLWFAVILWQLLEYRLDEREGRLLAAAFLFGAGLAENWGMLGFIPLFLMMIIWLRKLDFFNLHFLTGMTLCGLGGLLFLFLLPVLVRFWGTYPLGLWDALKPSLRTDWQVIYLLTRSDVRYDLALMSLTSLLPAFVMAMRWSASFGDSSRLGSTLVNYLVHVVNAVLFGVLLWVMFDPPFSPHKLAQGIVLTPALPLHYVSALCLGFYCGYALLIFGKTPIPGRRNSKPEPALPPPLLWLCPVIVAATLVTIVTAAGLLIYKNTPIIRAVNGDSFLKYAQFTEQKLPPNGAVLLCDSDDPAQDSPVRAFLLQAVLARDGRAQNYPVVDTRSLNWAPYHTYLHRHFPKIWPQTVAPNDVGGVSPLRIFVLLNQLSKSNNLCYLNPSFGYYFEQFYQEPHGLIYTLKPIPAQTVLPPASDTNLIAENETFWTQVLDSSRPAIEYALHPPDYSKLPGVIGWLMMHLHVSAEPDPNALMAATFYSRSLNFLGVQVQRAGELEKAAALFSDAQELNSNNVVASINLEFNQSLRAGSPTPLNLAAVTSDRFGKSHTWNEVVGANGPFDETSFCFAYGDWLMQATPPLTHQAAAVFSRVCQLAPDNLAARLFLAQIYIAYRLPDKALAILHDPLTQPARFALTEFNSTELNVLAASAHFQKNENAAGTTLLESEMARHPDDETLLLVSAQVFNMRGLYTNALHAIDRKLARSPDDPTWLYGKGIVSLQLGAYSDAAAALTRFLEIQTNNPDGVYNRGYAYFQNGQLDAARADFSRLQATYTNNFHVAYGLGEIAWRKHETNEALRNYQIFLANAPTNTAELETIRERVAQIGGK